MRRNQILELQRIMRVTPEGQWKDAMRRVLTAAIVDECMNLQAASAIKPTTTGDKSAT